jgi:hypothetical protein
MRIPLPAKSARVQFTSSDRPVATVGKAAEMPGSVRLVADLPREGAGARRGTGPGARRMIALIRGVVARRTWGGVDSWAIRRAVRGASGGSPSRWRG